MVFVLGFTKESIEQIPGADGRTFNVEVAASDDVDNLDLFAQAGTLTLTPLNDDADPDDYDDDDNDDGGR